MVTFQAQTRYGQVRWFQTLDLAKSWLNWLEPELAWKGVELIPSGDLGLEVVMEHK